MPEATAHHRNMEKHRWALVFSEAYTQVNFAIFPQFIENLVLLIEHSDCKVSSFKKWAKVQSPSKITATPTREQNWAI